MTRPQGPIPLRDPGWRRCGHQGRTRRASAAPRTQYIPSASTATARAATAVGPSRGTRPQPARAPRRRTASATAALCATQSAGRTRAGAPLLRSWSHMNPSLDRNVVVTRLDDDLVVVLQPPVEDAAAVTVLVLDREVRR